MTIWRERKQTIISRNVSTTRNPLTFSVTDVGGSVEVPGVAQTACDRGQGEWKLGECLIGNHVVEVRRFRGDQKRSQQTGRRHNQNPIGRNTSKRSNTRRKFHALEFVHVIYDVLLIGHQRQFSTIVEKHRTNDVLTGKTNVIELNPVRNQIIFLNPNLNVSGNVTDQQIFACHIPFENWDWALVGRHSGNEMEIELPTSRIRPGDKPTCTNAMECSNRRRKRRNR